VDLAGSLVGLLDDGVRSGSPFGDVASLDDLGAPSTCPLVNGRAPASEGLRPVEHERPLLVLDGDGEASVPLPRVSATTAATSSPAYRQWGSKRMGGPLGIQLG
jgi:hypothetical protein